MKNERHEELALMRRIEGALAELKRAGDQLTLIQLRNGSIGQKVELLPHDLILAVQQIVCRNAKVKLTDITHLPLRGKEKFSDARMIAMALCAKYKFAGTREIANRFGRKDHSTVLHASKRCMILMDVNEQFCKLYKKCDAEIQTLLDANKEPEYYI